LNANYRKSDLPITKQLRQVDYGSLFLLMPAAICIMAALQIGAEMMTWSSPLILTLFGVGTLALVLFVLSEIYVIKHNPVMPRRMMTTTNIAIFVAQFAGTACDYSVLYFVPLHYQIVRGDSAVQSALELFPFFIAGMISGLVSGALISKTGHYRIYLWSGGCLSVVGAALLSTLTVDSNIMHQYIYLAIIGLGAGLCHQSLVVAGQAAVSEEE
jgi:membrane-associated HD superfamily phosphohydrolase